MQEQYIDLYIISSRRTAMAERITNLIAKLLENVKVEHDGDKFVPFFSQDVEPIASELEALQTHVSKMDYDINDFKEILGEYRSIEEMARVKAAGQRAISSSSDTTKRAQAAAIKRGVPLADVEADPKVREAQLSADRIQREFSRKIEDLMSRIEKSKEILEKYQGVQ